MITIPRSLTRRLRIAFSRALGITARHPGPAVEFQSNNQGVFVRTHNHQVAIEYHHEAECPSPSWTVPLEMLRRCESTKAGDVSLTHDDDAVVARWTEAGIPQSAQFAEQTFGEFPALPERMVPNESRLVAALRDAVETTDSQASRFALDHLQLRGSDGRIAATDGRQLLVQGGFSFPWEEELLVPTNRLLTTGDLRDTDPVEIGSTEDWVTLRSGPWTLWFRIAKEARFPQVDDLIADPASAIATVHLTDQDASFLGQAIKGLPGNEEQCSPVTMDLNGKFAVRAKAAEQELSTELILSGSTRSGEPIRINTDRRYLARAVNLGFRDIALQGAESPACCRDDQRAFVWVPLTEESAIPHEPNATRIESAPASTSSTQANSNGHKPMSRNHNGHHQGNGTQASDTQPPNVLAQAEALRDSLSQALSQTRDLIATLKRQKKQNRLVETTLASLKQLQSVEV